MKAMDRLKARMKLDPRFADYVTCPICGSVIREHRFTWCEKILRKRVDSSTR